MASNTGIEELKAFVPTKSSGTAEWVSYWNILLKNWNKTIASGVFAKTWKQRKGGNADVVAIRKATGLALDNESILDGLSQVKSDALGVFDTMGTGLKVAAGVTGVLVVVLVGGLIIRIITASAQDIGTATGTAAKAFV